MSVEIIKTPEFFSTHVVNNIKCARFVVEATGIELAQERAIEYCLEQGFIGEQISATETIRLDDEEQARQRIVAPQNTNIRLIELSQPANIIECKPRWEILNDSLEELRLNPKV